MKCASCTSFRDRVRVLGHPDVAHPAVRRRFGNRKSLLSVLLGRQSGEDSRTAWPHSLSHCVRNQGCRVPGRQDALGVPNFPPLHRACRAGMKDPVKITRELVHRLGKMCGGGRQGAESPAPKSVPCARRRGFQAGFGTHPFMQQAQRRQQGGGAAASNPLQALLSMMPIILMVMLALWSGTSDPVRPPVLRGGLSSLQGGLSPV